MYALVAIGPDSDPSVVDNPKRFLELGQVAFGTIPVRFGISRIKLPSFDPDSNQDEDYVLVRVTAFSCNYRDKGLLLFNLESHPNSILPFGSEFSGEVVEVGSNVPEFKVGDRVMPESAYPDIPDEGVIPGVSTNFASQGCIRLHKGKLTKVPDTMDDVTAACFTLGAQTAMGMIRRSQILQEGGRPVVLSSRSATSLFITRFLLNHGFIPTCLSTSKWTEEEKALIEPAEVVQVCRDGDLTDITAGNFTHVFDPFIDMNLPLGARLLAMGGTYTTCGFLNQHPELYGESSEGLGLGIQNGLKELIVKNLRIQGNCLGSRSDLDRAVKMFDTSWNPVIVEEAFTFENVEGFIENSFFNPGKLGKSVMVMPPESDL